jgi:hypothetical protein
MEMEAELAESRVGAAGLPGTDAAIKVVAGE